jgi:hypothetical protein
LETAGSPKALSVRQNAGLVDDKHVAARLTELPIISMPPPTSAEFEEAGYDLLADLEKVDPESYLLHCMEIQRRKQFDGRHVVGGLAVLTAITRGGLTQRVVHTWPEDRPGRMIVPREIDWAKWREAAKASLSR